MPFTTETLNAFAMTGREAACEIPAAVEGLRAFVAVYPPSPRARRWTVRRFEIDALWLERGFDVSEEEMIGLEVRELPDLAAVERLLAEWDVPASAFTAPWRTDAPL